MLFSSEAFREVTYNAFKAEQLCRELKLKSIQLVELQFT